jgi:transcriptional regulator of acetoin/glycerol metabolism
MAPLDARSIAAPRPARAAGGNVGRLPGNAPATEVLESWARCASQRLDRAAPPPSMVIEAPSLARRREQLAPARRLALAEIDTLFHQIAGSNFLLAFADADGVILDLFADERFRSSGSSADIIVGSCWAEAQCGTNGLGTALASGRPVAVTGAEHFFLKYGDISCTAAPILDGQGRVLGVLDASSYVEARQRHTQALVRMSAIRVENVLLVEQMRGHLVVAVHAREEFLGTLGCGMLAFDGNGRVSAMNARAQGVFGTAALRLGMAFEDLFHTPFARAAAGLQADTDATWRDASGQPVAVRCLRPPEARRPAGFADRPTGLPTSLPGASAPARSSTRARAAAPVDPSASHVGAMVSDDAAVAATLRMAEAAVRLRVPILIQGETGTGKELLARHAHTSSGRGGAFVAVNCGALPAELFEAELFGYAGGAFTGARREGNVGLIESADGGTLLLDEIVELPLPLQAGLLRFLDDRMVRPVGARHARHVDVQLLAATHADLEAEVAARRFRADLLHRLNVVRLTLPPLRERDDFAAVARNVLATIDTQAQISDGAVAMLSRQPWHGNMRELRAVLTRALLMHDTGMLDASDFAVQCPVPGVEPHAPSALQQAALQRVVSEFERTGHSVSQTSRNLGVSRTTVYRYLREQGGQRR